jgi:hypothetical protein
LGIGTIRPSGDESTTIIASCFIPAGEAGSACHQDSFVAKWLFTVLSLATGYKGGEVTSLFFIGASAGYSVASWFGVGVAHTQLFASVGFVSVFGAAANVPLASTIMACELFGGRHVIYYAIACFIAYVVSGQSGIYMTQLRNRNKMAKRRGSYSGASGVSTVGRGGSKGGEAKANPNSSAAAAAASKV